MTLNRNLVSNKILLIPKRLFIIFILSLFNLSLFSQNIDIDILKHINSPQVLPSDNFYRFISNSDVYVTTGIPISMTIVGLASGNDELARNGSYMVGGMIINLGITAGLKYLIKRKRPFNNYPGIIINKSYTSCNDPSFPSGHSSTAFYTATSLSLSYRKWYIIAPSYLYAGTVAYSRMDLGVHYPSDVLGGIIIGTGSAVMVDRIRR